MSGIFPDTGAGGVVIRDIDGEPTNPPNVPNAYVPAETFTASCALTALPADCTARFSPAQINALVSEILCLAATMDPTGSWSCSSLCNLATAFTAWEAALDAVISFNGRGGAVTLQIGDLTSLDGAGSGLDADMLDGVQGALYALLASPAFTGAPTVPTAAPGTNTTQAASTAFVTAAIVAATAGVASFNTRTGAVTLTSGDVTTALGYTPWHVGNDGAGSGLDADLLDGLSSAAFALASHTHTASQIADSTAAGRALITAANAAAQTALLDAFNSTLKGLVPPSGGGTTNFLRADGAFAAPGGYVPSTTSTELETTFPIGHTVFVDTGGIVNKNSTATIYVGIAGAGMDSRYNVLAMGAALAGTWRSRGSIGTTTIYERVA